MISRFCLQNKFRKFFFILLVILISSFSVSAQEEWYLLFSGGNSPNRAAFFVDMNSVEIVSADIKSIIFVNVFEAPGNPQYTSSKMEFRCNSSEMRIVSGENYTYQNTSITFKDSPWQKISNSLFERVKKLACKSNEFNKARTVAKNSGGKIDNDKLNAELKKAGFGEVPILLMSGNVVSDFDTILEVLWSKFWNAKRPLRTGVAQIKKPQNSNVPKTNESAENLVKSGISNMKSGNYDKALTNFNQAIANSPSYSAAYANRGLLFYRVLEIDLAISNFTKAIELNPNDSVPYFNRGLAYFEQKHDFALAEADFSKVIQFNPQDAEAFFYRANVYESWGKDKLADADRKKWKDLEGTGLSGFDGRKRTLYPDAVFDANLAEQSLKEGASTLIGRACVTYEREKFNASFTRVMLYPATPYLEKWYLLREKKESKSVGVFINYEASKYFLSTQTNSEGKFVFSRLKPGKYFIQMFFSFNQLKTEEIYAGSDFNTDYYWLRDYYVPRDDRLETFVEIKQNGETKEVTLKNKWKGLLGCRSLF